MPWKAKTAEPLASEERPDAVPEPFDIDYLLIPPTLAEEQKPSARQESSRIFHTFQDAFAEQDGRTLLLGIPGGGKTTTLFHFAWERAQAYLNGTSPYIPLVRSIHQWDHKALLSEWAQAPIKKGFPGIRFADHPLLYIFDGLDELGNERPVDPRKPDGEKYDPRLTFLRALAEQLPDAPIVITCREQDYNEIGEKVQLNGAVKLLPLKPDQIKNVLIERGQPLLWQNLQEDKGLLKLAETPLLLTLLSDAVGSSGNLSTSETSFLNANTIFDFYISKIFEHETQKHTLPFTEETTRTLLGQLGSVMWSGWTISVLLNIKTVQKIIGTKYRSFIDFACSRHFLRTSSHGIEFIHLKFRDFCAVPALIQALKDQDANVRQNAAIALGKIRDVSAVPALIQALKDQDEEVRQNATNALVNIGEEAIPALIQALKSQGANVRWYTTYTLGEIGDVSAVPALIQALKDQNENVRQYTADALRKIGDVSAAPALIQALKDQNENVRWYAAYALSKIGDVSAVPALIKTLKDQNENVRRYAAYALSKIGDVSAVPALIKTLKDQNENVRRNATNALVNIGEEAIPALIQALKSQGANVRWYTTYTLGEIGDVSAVPALIQALKDQDANVRQNAAYALSKIRDVSAVPALTEALKDQDENVRWYATDALNKINRKAIPPLPSTPE